MISLLASLIAASIFFSPVVSAYATSAAGTLCLKLNRYRVSARDEPRIARRQAKTFLAALDNDIYLYTINVTVGTPPQSLSLQVDTGSSDIWFPAKTARFCQQQGGCPSGTYNQAASSSYQDPGLPPFAIQYVDGSEFSGTYVSDILQIGSTRLSNMTMASATQLTQIGIGIMGVGFDSNEVGTEQYGFTYPNVVSLLQKEGFINARAYSLWLDDLNSSTGSILFGGVDTSKYHGDLVALPIQMDSRTNNVTSFTVAWTGLTVSGSDNDLDISPSSPQPAVLDSGTTDTLLPDDIAHKIYSGVGVEISPDYGYTVPCKRANDDLTFSFIFGGAGGPSINISVSDFVYPLSTVDGTALKFPNGDTVCNFGIEEAGQNPIIFGDTFLRSAYVVYDLENAMIGLAQTDFNSHNGNGNVLAFNAASSGIPGVSSTATSASVAQTVSSIPKFTPSMSATATGSQQLSGYPSPTFHLSSIAGGRPSSSASQGAATSGTSARSGANIMPADRTLVMGCFVLLFSVLYGMVG